MTRDTDTGIWAFTHRELKFWVLVVPLVTALLSAGAAWAGVKYGLDGKVDKPDFAAHVMSTSMNLDRLRLADSLQRSEISNMETRLTQIVCYRVTAPACR